MGAKVDSNKDRKVDGKTKKRLIYLADKNCDQCGTFVTKALRIMPHCYIDRVKCINCIKHNHAIITYKYVTTRFMVCSNATVKRIRLKKYKECFYCGEHRTYALRIENPKRPGRLKCYNCYEEEKLRSYDAWWWEYVTSHYRKNPNTYNG